MGREEKVLVEGAKQGLLERGGRGREGKGKKQRRVETREGKGREGSKGIFSQRGFLVRFALIVLRGGVNVVETPGSRSERLGLGARGTGWLTRVPCNKVKTHKVVLGWNRGRPRFEVDFLMSKGTPRAGFTARWESRARDRSIRTCKPRYWFDMIDAMPWWWHTYEVGVPAPPLIKTMMVEASCEVRAPDPWTQNQWYQGPECIERRVVLIAG